MNRRSSAPATPTKGAAGPALRDGTIDELVAAVRRLRLPQLAAFLDALAGMQAVADCGWRVKERRVAPERFAARNAEIRGRHARGESHGQLALDYGITPSAVAKVVQRGRRKSLDARIASTPGAEIA